MGAGETIAAVALIICGMPVAITGLALWYNLAKKRGPRDQQALLSEIRALREEVQQLRCQHQDAILSFDAIVDRVERRLSSVESQLALGSGAEPREHVRSRMG